MDLIDRRATMESLTREYNRKRTGEGLRLAWIEKAINEVSSVEPKMGHWIKISPAGIYECSQCGQNVMTGDIEVYAYCHHCGAYMKEDTDETD